MYKCDITEDKFLSAANEFVNLGLKDAGYEYINSEGPRTYLACKTNPGLF